MLENLEASAPEDELSWPWGNREDPAEGAEAHGESGVNHHSQEQWSDRPFWVREEQP